MTPATLAALCRLRRTALEGAARALAEAQAAQDRADDVAHAAHRRLETERAAALDLAADDADVEAYVAWLPRGRAAVTEAELARSRAMDETTLARHRLAAARIAMEAAERLVEQQHARARARRDHAERQVLQEANCRKREGG